MVFREVGTFEEISPLPCYSSAGWFMDTLILGIFHSLGLACLEELVHLYC